MDHNRPQTTSLRDPDLCKTLRCCFFFPEISDPIALSKVSELPVEVTRSHLKLLQDDHVLALEEQPGSRRWRVQLEDQVFSQACSIAEARYLEEHSTWRVDIEGRLECLADIFDMIQHAKGSLCETASKS